MKNIVCHAILISYINLINLAHSETYLFAHFFFAFWLLFFHALWSKKLTSIFLYFVFIYVDNITEYSSDISYLHSWEDGVMDEQDEPFSTETLAVPIYSNAWSNVWEYGNGERAYRLANANYKVREPTDSLDM